MEDDVSRIESGRRVGGRPRGPLASSQFREDTDMGDRHPNGPTGPSTVPECEFCAEFASPAASRFGRCYAGLATTRAVMDDGMIAAMPTMGQIFMGSMLVLPRRHWETTASMPARERAGAVSAALDLARVLRTLGNPVIFEHGATCPTGGGCGIYHAHLHVVPLPGDVAWREVLPGESREAASLDEALDGLASAQQYLLFHDTAGRTAMLDIAGAPGSAYPSQYFRRRLAERFGRADRWDWRRSTGPEALLLDSINWFRTRAMPATTARAG